MPRNDVELQTQIIWNEIMNIERISVDSNLFDIGATSVDIMTFISKVYAEMGIELAIRDIFMNPCIEGCAALIQDIMNREDYTNDYMQLSVDTDQEIIFCFPPISSFGVEYIHLANELIDYSIYSFNYIADSNNIDRYIDYIKKLQKEGPYTLIGHSAGGILAYQVARRLEEAGDIVKMVILIDTIMYQSNIVRDEQVYVNEAQKIITDLLSRMERFKKQEQLLNGYLLPKIIHYFKYLENKNTEFMINAPVHFIAAESVNQVHADNLYKQSEGRAKIYQGAGTHNQMLLSEYVETNAQIIDDILKTNEAEVST